jgi:DnaJ like chaperone protein
VFLPYAALPEDADGPVRLELWSLTPRGERLAHAQYDVTLPEHATWFTENLLGGLVSAAVQMVLRHAPLERSEVSRIREVMKQAFELDDLGDYALRSTLKAAHGAPRDMRLLAAMLAQHLDADAHPMIIGFLYDIASVDGKIDPREEQFIEELCRALGIAPAVRDNARRRATGQSADEGPRAAPPPSASLDVHYQTLELGPGASWDEVRAAYRRLAREYHPDKVQNLAKGFRDYATQRMTQINAAYQALRAGLGQRD